MEDPLQFIVSNPALISALASTAAAAAAAIALLYAANESKKRAKIERGNFWLKLEQMFQRYDPLYKHLRFETGDWFCQDNLGPGPYDKPLLCDYLGLFEHSNLLIDQGVIDLRTFKSIYMTRVMGLLSNKIIREDELGKHRARWANFYRLLLKLKLATDEEEGITIIDHGTGLGWRVYIQSDKWRK